MIKIMLKYKWYVVAIVALIVIEPTINAMLNFWLQGLFNSAVVGANKIAILRLLTGGFLLWMLKRVITYSMLIIRDRYICNLKADVKSKVFSKILSVNTANIHENVFSGEYISMFTNDVLLLEQRFFNQIIGLISGVFSVLILGYSFVALNAVLAWSIIGFGIFTMFVPLAFSAILNSKNLAYTKKIAKFTQKLKEYIVAFPTIKNYSIEPSIMENFNVFNKDTENAKFEADCTISLANSIGQLSAWFMQFIGVGLGVMLVIKGDILIGTVIAAQSFASDLALPLQNIIISVNSIRSVRSVIKKLENVCNQYNTSETALSNLGKTEHCDNCTVKFQNVSLELDGKKVVEDFSYTFEANKKYLVVGVNGSGKSSVFKILKKWHRNHTGTITVNDKSIMELSGKQLSGLVSYLNENVLLFSGTVKDNIVLFRQYTDDAFQRAVCESHMALNLNREIVDEGRNISSGEQRRIEIARSLLGDSPVLIFDEVISTLDIETAYEIEQYGLGLKDKTVIFISHNFSGKLIRQYDGILVMDKGKLLAAGKYDELLHTCQYFRRICEIKFGNLSTKE